MISDQLCTPAIRRGVDPLELGRDIPVVPNAIIIDKAHSVVLIIRSSKGPRIPLHTLHGRAAKALRLSDSSEVVSPQRRTQ